MVFNLDVRDRKILYELDKDSRQPLNNIAKKVRISPQAVENRINKMLDNKVINSFQIVIAYHRLGYTTYVMYLTFQNTSSKKEIEIIEKLKSYPSIIAVWRCEGIYDLLLGIQAKTVFELNSILTRINNDVGEFIRNYDLVTHTGADHYSRNYLINKGGFTQQPFRTGGEEFIEALDKTDSLILNTLIKNPRMNFVDLAKKLNLTVDIIRYRFKKLKERRIIQGFSIVLNPANFGYQNFRVLFKLKNITEQIKKEIFAFANLHPNIKLLNQSFGAYEFSMDVEAGTNEQLREILTQFRNKFNEVIHHHDILNIYSIEKYITFVS